MFSICVRASFGLRHRGERGRLDGRQELVPDQVQDGLHVLDAAGDGDHGVLLGQHDAVLPEGPVAAIGAVAAAPELVAVALVPVAFGIAPVGGLPRGGRLHPGRGDKLLALPLALLQVELAEPGDVLGADAQAETAGRNALGAGLPGWVFDSQGPNSRGRR